eukprot:scaffold231731_cov14-Tisochrysis_lutea.AAC.1
MAPFKQGSTAPSAPFNHGRKPNASEPYLKSHHASRHTRAPGVGNKHSAQRPQVCCQRGEGGEERTTRPRQPQHGCVANPGWHRVQARVA